MAVISGLCSGIALLLKPLWILGAFVIVLVYVAFNINEFKKSLYIASLVIISNLFVWSLWQCFLIVNFGQFRLSRVGSINFNMVTIRAGLTRYAENTPLYIYLEKNNLLKTAKELTWNDYDKFIEIKGKIPWDERADNEFYKKAFFSNPWPLLKVKSKEWVYIFNRKPIIINVNSSFKCYPIIIQKIYYNFYKILFSNILICLLIISFLLWIYNLKFRFITLLSSMIILYYASIITLLSYQIHHYTRMRIGLEPIMFFVAFIPLGLLTDNIIIKIKTIQFIKNLFKHNIM